MSRYSEKIELMEMYIQETKDIEMMNNLATLILNTEMFSTEDELDQLLQSIAAFINEYYYSKIVDDSTKKKEYLRENLLDLPINEKYNKFLMLENRILERKFQYFYINDKEKEEYKENFIKIFEDKCNLQLLHIYGDKKRRFTNIG